MSKTILVVDDSETIREAVQFTLAQAGYTITTADNGANALTLLEQGKVDLIISDLNMPVMGGMELIQKVRAGTVNKYTPILMLTTESNQDKKMEGKSAGATGWIVKPFKPEILLATVAKVLR
ncbi:MAG: response regulator [Magnetococcales bacterium]|nr:response regulator [Magnetococcales bacterium]